MRLFAFEPGEPVEEWGSSGVFASRIFDQAEPVRNAVLHYAASSELGPHLAGVPQLFYVANGRGWVAGADAVRRPIEPGTAAFFAAGEMHSSGSAAGMTVFVVQSAALDPDAIPAREVT